MTPPKIYIVILALSITGSVSASGIPAEKHLRRWTTADGLPHNTITCALQSRSGYIWVGTNSGLCRFDGVRFEQYTAANSGLLNDHITVLFESADSALWIGTDTGGLSLLQAGKWRSWDLPHKQVRAITQDWRGNIWIGTSFGLIRIGPDGERHFTVDDGLPDNIITALTVDHTGRLWIGTLQDGLAWFESDRIYPFGYREGLTVTAVTALYTDHMGFLWVGTRQGLFTFDPREQLFRLVTGTIHTPTTWITEDPQNQLWIATMTDGIKKIKGQTSAGYKPGEGFPGGHVTVLFFDRDTSLWIGTDREGLCQWVRRPVGMIPPEEKFITSLIADSSGGIWAASRDAGLFRLAGTKITGIFNRDRGMPGERIKDICSDGRGRLWILTEDAGLIRHDRTGFTSVISAGTKPFRMMNTIAGDRTGNCWIGTSRGLYRYSGGLTSPAVLPDRDVRVILPAADGRLFAGTASGVWVNQADADTFFQPLAATMGITVSAVYLRPGNNLLIGTPGNGLFCFRSDSLYQISSANGLPDDHIVSITEDTAKNVWLGTHNGIVCLPDTALEAFLSGAAGYIRPVWFNESDGMVRRACSPGILCTESNDLYFATVAGIAHINGSEISRRSSGIEPLIENYDPQVLGTARRLDLRVTAFDYLAPGRLHFRYMLQGADSGFRYLSPHSVRRIIYEDLQPGNYRLVLQAAGNRSSWQGQPGILAFTVPIPWYFRPAGILPAVALLGLLFSGTLLYLRRVKHLRQINKYRTISLDPAQSTAILAKLNTIMDTEQLYLDPDLSIGQLADRMKLHSNYLSRTVNEHFGLGFNDYLNRLRIETVCARFRDPINRSKTILEIMYATGFNSKSVFNTAFKKFTGMTPTEFRRKLS